MLRIRTEVTGLKTQSSILLIIFLLIVFPSQSEAHPIKYDHLCNATRQVLCIRDVLTSINKTAKDIHDKAIEAELEILRRDVTVDQINYYIAREIKAIQGHLPNETFHAKFSKLNNIHRVRCLSGTFF